MSGKDKPSKKKEVFSLSIKVGIIDSHFVFTTIYKKVDKNNSVEVDVIKAKNIEIIQQINKLVDVVKSQGIRIENLEQKLKKN